MPDNEVSELLREIVDILHNNQRAPKKSASDRLLKVLPVLATVVTIALAVTAINNRLGQVIDNSLPNTNNNPLSETKIKGVTASSYREDVGVGHNSVHSPVNVLDDDPSTDWEECGGGKPIYEGASRMTNCAGGSSTCNEAGADTSDEGQWLRIQLTDSEKLKAVAIRNGFEESNELYYRNPRVKTLKVTLNNSERTLSINLLDEQGYQTFSLPNDISVQSIKFAISANYPGECWHGSDPYGDTSISDVLLIPANGSGRV